MKFVCDRCGKRYSSTDEPVPGKLYRIPCKCGHVILVRGNATGGVTPAFPVGTPTPGAVLPGPPAPSSPPSAPRSPPAPAGPDAGVDVPQFDGDPFAASVAPNAHPAATSAADLGLPGAFADPRPPAPSRREPGLRLEEPTPPSLRQPFPEPRPFAAPDGALDLEPLTGGPPRPPEVTDPDDPFAGLAASLGDGGIAPPPPSPPPTFHRPAAVAPPPFARVDRGGGERVAPASFSARLRPRRSRRRLFLGALAVLAVAGAGVAGFLLFSRGAPSTDAGTEDAAPPPRARVRRPETPPAGRPQPPPAETAPPPAPVAAAPAAPVEPPRAPAERPPRETASRPRTQPRRPPPAPEASPEAPPVAPERVAAPPAPGPKRTLQPEDVIAVVRARRGEFDACIAQAVETSGPGGWLGRRVELLVFVSPSGRVSSAAVDDAEVEPTELGACLRLVARKMVFPAFQGEAVPLSLPLRLGKAE
jgi:hypothetical protein